ncbi:MAG: YheC/YheD family protein [Chitinophagales bacterium]
MKPKGSIRVTSTYPHVIKKPLIGVLTCPLGRMGKKTPTIKRRAFRELIILSGRMGVTVYMFAPESVNWKNNTVTGATLVKTNGKYRWRDYRFPIPDVVYNRVPNRQLERQPAVRVVKEKLINEYHAKYFNPCYLDKWTSYCWLKQSLEILPHLPETHQLNINSFNEMIAQYDCVYIKLKTGSVGKGIIRINKINDHFLMTSKNEEGYHSEVSNQGIESSPLIQKLCNSGRYIIQRGIDLARYQNRIFDVRTLVQKDIRGKWCLTGTAVRAAPLNAHLTHVPNGGQAFPLKTVLLQLLHDEKRVTNLIKQLVQFAIKVAESLEKYSGHQFGEVSLDIGLDRDMHIWLIEVNSKPFRFDEKEIRYLSRRRIVEYARHISSVRIEK